VVAMLTKSAEDYLEAIYMIEMQGETVRSVRIAAMLNVSKPAVNKAMNHLKDHGLIDKKDYSSIKLTEKGREAAKKVYRKHTALKEFLMSLGVSEETAEEDGCKIEHIISKETFDHILAFLKQNKTSP
jgi:Mn-dependent DtxR family transcriptional regulator